MFERSLRQWSLLVRRVTAIVDKIAAHPTDLAEFLISVAVEDFKIGGINESVVAFRRPQPGGLDVKLHSRTSTRIFAQLRK
jgi:hypothetical protein